MRGRARVRFRRRAGRSRRSRLRHGFRHLSVRLRRPRPRSVSRRGRGRSGIGRGGNGLWRGPLARYRNDLAGGRGCGLGLGASRLCRGRRGSFRRCRGAGACSAGKSGGRFRRSRRRVRFTSRRGSAGICCRSACGRPRHGRYGQSRRRLSRGLRPRPGQGSAGSEPRRRSRRHRAGLALGPEQACEGLGGRIARNGEWPASRRRGRLHRHCHDRTGWRHPLQPTSSASSSRSAPMPNQAAFPASSCPIASTRWQNPQHGAAANTARPASAETRQANA